MNRINVIQMVANRIKAQTYLEIGVAAGCSFLQVDVPKKIAVDTQFKIDRYTLRHYLRHLISNIRNEYYQMNSDDFFNKHVAVFKDKKIDIAFIDGFHEYHQAVRDTMNCLNHLSENGVIILHDCNPFSEECAYPPEKRVTNAWMGDVWKAIVYFRSKHKDLNVFVLNLDCGLGVITRGKADSMLFYTEKEIETLPYKVLEQNRIETLNLKEGAYLESFLKRAA